MVDFATYEGLHSDTTSFKRSYPVVDDPDCERMESSTIDSDDPPSAPDIYLFPNTIPGYNLRKRSGVSRTNICLLLEAKDPRCHLEHPVI